MFISDVIYHYIATNKVLLNKIIIHHINVVAKQHSDNLFSFKKYFIRTAKLYICTV